MSLENVKLQNVDSSSRALDQLHSTMLLLIFRLSPRFPHCHLVLYFLNFNTFSATMLRIWIRLQIDRFWQSPSLWFVRTREWDGLKLMFRAWTLKRRRQRYIFGGNDKDQGNVSHTEVDEKRAKQAERLMKRAQTTFAELIDNYLPLSLSLCSVLDLNVFWIMWVIDDFFYSLCSLIQLLVIDVLSR